MKSVYLYKGNSDYERYLKYQEGWQEVATLWNDKHKRVFTIEMRTRSTKESSTSQPEKDR